MAYVIVGGGLAGAKAAETLRKEGFDGPVVLVAAEAEAPYERPPLSKGYLLGNDERESAFVHPEPWYAEHDVDLRLATRATAIDPAAREVELAGGERLSYDRLLLATGSIPRRLDVPGADLDGVLYLRELPDADRIAVRSPAGEPDRRRGRGLDRAGGRRSGPAPRCRGAVLEVADLPLQRVLGDRVAAVFADLHREHGVDLRLGSGVAEIRGAGGRVSGVVTSAGDELPADAVVVGIGIRPAVELAEAAGVTLDDGVVVDAGLHTSDARRLRGRRRRGRRASAARYGAFASSTGPTRSTAARRRPGRCSARTSPTTALPYFFTDQYDLGMEYIGHAPPGCYDRVVVRGDLGRARVPWRSGCTRAACSPACTSTSGTRRRRRSRRWSPGPRPRPRAARRRLPVDPADGDGSRDTERTGTCVA